jgi:hypothetical protein
MLPSLTLKLVLFSTYIKLQQNPVMENIMKSLKIKVILLMPGVGLGTLILIIAVSLFSISRYSSQLLKLNKEIIFNDYDKNVKN